MAELIGLSYPVTNKNKCMFFDISIYDINLFFFYYFVIYFSKIQFNNLEPSGSYHLYMQSINEITVKSKNYLTWAMTHKVQWNSELQIRLDIVDNSEIIILIS